MLVRMCDSCRQVLNAEHHCVAVAVRGKTGVALQRVATESEPPPNATAHFCADECVVEFVKLWLMDGLPFPAQLGAVAPVVTAKPHPPRNGNGSTPVLEEVGDMSGLPPIPQLPTRREPTPEEISAQNAILGSVLGGH